MDWIETGMKLPNFYLIGAPKAGTTSVYEFLDEHPQVFMCPVKEPNFFYREGCPLTDFAPYKQHRIASLGLELEGNYTVQFYSSLFAGSAGEPVVGEASVSYIFHSESVIAGIRRYTPQAKLLAIFRNPIERTYSQYLHALMYQGERIRDFAKALEESPERKLYLSTFADHLERYMEAFGADQLKICLYEDLCAQPVEFMEDIYRYLGVAPDFRPGVGARHNRTYYPKTNLVGHFLTLTEPARKALRKVLPAEVQVWLYEQVVLAVDRKFNRAEVPPLPPEARDYLVDHFQSDIERLEKLIERDLSPWLEQFAPGRQDLAKETGSPR